MRLAKNPGNVFGLKNLKLTKEVVHLHYRMHDFHVLVPPWLALNFISDKNDEDTLWKIRSCFHLFFIPISCKREEKQFKYRLYLIGLLLKSTLQKGVFTVLSTNISNNCYYPLSIAIKEELVKESVLLPMSN